MAGEGNRGSTSGMKFNPREGPEFMEEDRNLGMDDADSKQRQEEKKLAEKENRHKKLSGLQHLSVKVQGKKRPTGDKQRDDERLSELTGPASSTGYPLDVASGAKTGGGAAMGGNPVNIMTGEMMPIDLEIFQKKAKKSPKGRHGKTEDIQTLRTRERTKRTRKQRKKTGETALSRIYGGKSMVGSPRNIGKYTEQRKPIAERVKPGSKGAIRRGHGARTKALKQQIRGGARREQTPDPRNVAASIETSQAARSTPTHTSPYNLASMQAYENVMRPRPKGVRTDTPQLTASDYTPQKSKNVSRPGVARTLGGQDIEGRAGQGPTDGMTGFQTGSPIAASLDTLREYEDLLTKANLSAADLTEFKWLVREMRRLLRSGALKKSGLEDSEHDDERPSPNAHRQTTSHPTGATEVDPDDDPRYWGAHPIGLLLPRRGHQ